MFPKDSKRIQKRFLRFQKNPKDSTRIQENPKDSKRIQTILEKSSTVLGKALNPMGPGRFFDACVPGVCAFSHPLPK